MAANRGGTTGFLVLCILIWDTEGVFFPLEVFLRSPAKKEKKT